MLFRSRILHRFAIAGRNLNGIWICVGVVLHDDGVFQTSFGSEFFANDFLEKRYIVLFQPLIKKLGWYLNGQYAFFETNRLDRLKPGFKSLRAYVILYNFQTVLPNLVMVFLHVAE